MSMSYLRWLCRTGEPRLGAGTQKGGFGGVWRRLCGCRGGGVGGAWLGADAGVVLVGGG